MPWLWWRDSLWGCCERTSWWDLFFFRFCEFDNWTIYCEFAFCMLNCLSVMWCYFPCVSGFQSMKQCGSTPYPSLASQVSIKIRRIVFFMPWRQKTWPQPTPTVKPIEGPTASPTDLPTASPTESQTGKVKGTAFENTSLTMSDVQDPRSSALYYWQRGQLAVAGIL